jgi:1,2-diacylglycerol 3-beta-galactosyltransferase
VGRIRDILIGSTPDLIVSIHPWANYLPAWLLQELSWKVPLVTVVFDLVTIHYWWLCPDVDLCLVPTLEVRRKALEKGLAPEKVKVIGVPVDLEFLSPSKEQGELREEVGLAADVFTILVMGGGEGMGNVFDVARAVAQASLRVQLLIVAGRNEKLRATLEAVVWELPTRTLGFAGNMPDLMHAADLIITKAGPTTISEALACGLPMLISGSLRGQEEGSAEWVVERGAGLLTPTPQKVLAVLKELLRPENDALARMAQSARRAAKPLAALEAATLIDSLLC